MPQLVEKYYVNLSASCPGSHNIVLGYLRSCQYFLVLVSSSSEHNTFRCSKFRDEDINSSLNIIWEFQFESHFSILQVLGWESEDSFLLITASNSSYNAFVIDIPNKAVFAVSLNNLRSFSVSDIDQFRKDLVIGTRSGKLMSYSLRCSDTKISHSFQAIARQKVQLSSGEDIGILDLKNQDLVGITVVLTPASVHGFDTGTLEEVWSVPCSRFLYPPTSIFVDKFSSDFLVCCHDSDAKVDTLEFWTPPRTLSLINTGSGPFYRASLPINERILAVWIETIFSVKNDETCFNSSHVDLSNDPSNRFESGNAQIAVLLANGTLHLWHPVCPMKDNLVWDCQLSLHLILQASFHPPPRNVTSTFAALPSLKGLTCSSPMKPSGNNLSNLSSPLFSSFIRFLKEQKKGNSGSFGMQILVILDGQILLTSIQEYTNVGEQAQLFLQDFQALQLHYENTSSSSSSWIPSSIPTSIDAGSNRLRGSSSTSLLPSSAPKSTSSSTNLVSSSSMSSMTHANRPTMNPRNRVGRLSSLASPSPISQSVSSLIVSSSAVPSSSLSPMSTVYEADTEALSNLARQATPAPPSPSPFVSAASASSLPSEQHIPASDIISPKNGIEWSNSIDDSILLSSQFNSSVESLGSPNNGSLKNGHPNYFDFDDSKPGTADSMALRALQLEKEIVSQDTLLKKSVRFTPLEDLLPSKRDNEMVVDEDNQYSKDSYRIYGSDLPNQVEKGIMFFDPKTLSQLQRPPQDSFSVPSSTGGRDVVFPTVRTFFPESFFLSKNAPNSSLLVLRPPSALLRYSTKSSPRQQLLLLTRLCLSSIETPIRDFPQIKLEIQLIAFSSRHNMMLVWTKQREGFLFSLEDLSLAPLGMAWEISSSSNVMNLQVIDVSLEFLDSTTLSGSQSSNFLCLAGDSRGCLHYSLCVFSPASTTAPGIISTISSGMKLCHSLAIQSILSTADACRPLWRLWAQPMSLDSGYSPIPLAGGSIVTSSSQEINIWSPVFTPLNQSNLSTKKISSKSSVYSVSSAAGTSSKTMKNFQKDNLLRNFSWEWKLVGSFSPSLLCAVGTGRECQSLFVDSSSTTLGGSVAATKVSLTIPSVENNNINQSGERAGNGSQGVTYLGGDRRSSSRYILSTVLDPSCTTILIGFSDGSMEHWPLPGICLSRTSSVTFKASQMPPLQTAQQHLQTPWIVHLTSFSMRVWTSPFLSCPWEMDFYLSSSSKTKSFSSRSIAGRCLDSYRELGKHSSLVTCSADQSMMLFSWVPFPHPGYSASVLANNNLTRLPLTYFLAPTPCRRLCFSSNIEQGICFPCPSMTSSTKSLSTLEQFFGDEDNNDNKPSNGDSSSTKSMLDKELVDMWCLEAVLSGSHVSITCQPFVDMFRPEDNFMALQITTPSDNGIVERIPSQESLNPQNLHRSTSTELVSTSNALASSFVVHYQGLPTIPVQGQFFKITRMVDAANKEIPKDVSSWDLLEQWKALALEQDGLKVSVKPNKPAVANSQRLKGKSILSLPETEIVLDVNRATDDQRSKDTQEFDQSEFSKPLHVEFKGIHCVVHSEASLLGMNMQASEHPYDTNSRYVVRSTNTLSSWRERALQNTLGANPLEMNDDYDFPTPPLDMPPSKMWSSTSEFSSASQFHAPMGSLSVSIPNVEEVIPSHPHSPISPYRNSSTIDLDIGVDVTQHRLSPPQSRSTSRAGSDRIITTYDKNSLTPAPSVAIGEGDIDLLSVAGSGVDSGEQYPPVLLSNYLHSVDNQPLMTSSVASYGSAQREHSMKSMIKDSKSMTSRESSSERRENDDKRKGISSFQEMENRLGKSTKAALLRQERSLQQKDRLDKSNVKKICYTSRTSITKSDKLVQNPSSQSQISTARVGKPKCSYEESLRNKGQPMTSTPAVTSPDVLAIHDGDAMTLTEYNVALSNTNNIPFQSNTIVAPLTAESRWSPHQEEIVYPLPFNSRPTTSLSSPGGGPLAAQGSLDATRPPSPIFNDSIDTDDNFDVNEPLFSHIPSPFQPLHQISHSPLSTAPSTPANHGQVTSRPPTSSSGIGHHKYVVNHSQARKSENSSRRPSGSGPPLSAASGNRVHNFSLGSDMLVSGNEAPNDETLPTFLSSDMLDKHIVNRKPPPVVQRLVSRRFDNKYGSLASLDGSSVSSEPPESLDDDGLLSLVSDNVLSSMSYQQKLEMKNIFHTLDDDDLDVFEGLDEKHRNEVVQAIMKTIEANMRYDENRPDSQEGDSKKNLKSIARKIINFARMKKTLMSLEGSGDVVLPMVEVEIAQVGVRSIELLCRSSVTGVIHALILKANSDPPPLDIFRTLRSIRAYEGLVCHLGHRAKPNQEVSITLTPLRSRSLYKAMAFIDPSNKNLKMSKEAFEITEVRVRTMPEKMEIDWNRMTSEQQDAEVRCASRCTFIVNHPKLKSGMIPTDEELAIRFSENTSGRTAMKKYKEFLSVWLDSNVNGSSGAPGTAGSSDGNASTAGSVLSTSSASSILSLLGTGLEDTTSPRYLFYLQEALYLIQQTDMLKICSQEGAITKDEAQTLSTVARSIDRDTAKSHFGTLLENDIFRRFRSWYNGGEQLEDCFQLRKKEMEEALQRKIQERLASKPPVTDEVGDESAGEEMLDDGSQKNSVSAGEPKESESVVEENDEENSKKNDDKDKKKNKEDVDPDEADKKALKEFTFDVILAKRLQERTSFLQSRIQETEDCKEVVAKLIEGCRYADKNKLSQEDLLHRRSKLKKEDVIAIMSVLKLQEICVNRELISKGRTLDASKLGNYPFSTQNITQAEPFVPMNPQQFQPEMPPALDLETIPGTNRRGIKAWQSCSLEEKTLEVILAISLDAIAFRAVDDGIALPDPEDAFQDKKTAASRFKRYEDFYNWYAGDEEVKKTAGQGIPTLARALFAELWESIVVDSDPFVRRAMGSLGMNLPEELPLLGDLTLQEMDEETEESGCGGGEGDKENNGNEAPVEFPGSDASSVGSLDPVSEYGDDEDSKISGELSTEKKSTRQDDDVSLDSLNSGSNMAPNSRAGSPSENFGGMNKKRRRPNKLNAKPVKGHRRRSISARKGIQTSYLESETNFVKSDLVDTYEGSLHLAVGIFLRYEILRRGVNLIFQGRRFTILRSMLPPGAHRYENAYLFTPTFFIIPQLMYPPRRIKVFPSSSIESYTPEEILKWYSASDLEKDDALLIKGELDGQKRRAYLEWLSHESERMQYSREMMTEEDENGHVSRQYWKEMEINMVRHTEHLVGSKYLEYIENPFRQVQSELTDDAKRKIAKKIKEDQDKAALAKDPLALWLARDNAPGEDSYAITAGEKTPAKNSRPKPLSRGKSGIANYGSSRNINSNSSNSNNSGNSNSNSNSAKKAKAQEEPFRYETDEEIEAKEAEAISKARKEMLIKRRKELEDLLSVEIVEESTAGSLDRSITSRNDLQCSKEGTEEGIPAATVKFASSITVDLDLCEDNADHSFPINAMMVDEDNALVGDSSSLDPDSQPFNAMEIHSSDENLKVEGTSIDIGTKEDNTSSGGSSTRPNTRPGTSSSRQSSRPGTSSNLLNAEESPSDLLASNVEDNRVKVIKKRIKLDVEALKKTAVFDEGFDDSLDGNHWNLESEIINYLESYEAGNGLQNEEDWQEIIEEQRQEAQNALDNEQKLQNRLKEERKRREREELARQRREEQDRRLAEGLERRRLLREHFEDVKKQRILKQIEEARLMEEKLKEEEELKRQEEEQQRIEMARLKLLRLESMESQKMSEEDIFVRELGSRRREVAEMEHEDIRSVMRERYDDLLEIHRERRMNELKVIYEPFEPFEFRKSRVKLPHLHDLLDHDVANLQDVLSAEPFLNKISNVHYSSSDMKSPTLRPSVLIHDNDENPDVHNIINRRNLQKSSKLSMQAQSLSEKTLRKQKNQTNVRLLPLSSPDRKKAQNSQDRTILNRQPSSNVKEKMSLDMDRDLLDWEKKSLQLALASLSSLPPEGKSILRPSFKLGTINLTPLHSKSLSSSLGGPNEVQMDELAIAISEDKNNLTNNIKSKDTSMESFRRDRAWIGAYSMSGGVLEDEHFLMTSQPGIRKHPYLSGVPLVQRFYNGILDDRKDDWEFRPTGDSTVDNKSVNSDFSEGFPIHQPTAAADEELSALTNSLDKSLEDLTLVSKGPSKRVTPSQGNQPKLSKKHRNMKQMRKETQQRIEVFEKTAEATTPSAIAAAISAAAAAAAGSSKTASVDVGVDVGAGVGQLWGIKGRSMQKKENQSSIGGTGTSNNNPSALKKRTDSSSSSSYRSLAHTIDSDHVDISPFYPWQNKSTAKENSSFDSKKFIDNEKNVDIFVNDPQNELESLSEYQQSNNDQTSDLNESNINDEMSSFFSASRNNDRDILRDSIDNEESIDFFENNLSDPRNDDANETDLKPPSSPPPPPVYHQVSLPECPILPDPIDDEIPFDSLSSPPK